MSENGKLDVERLIADLGGVARVAEMTDSPRTAPYRWLRTGRIGSDKLVMIKASCPEIDLDDYIQIEAR